MRKELFNLAESIYDESNQDTVIVIGVMDKEQGIVTKWANCADMPVIEHVIHEFNDASR